MAPILLALRLLPGPSGWSEALTAAPTVRRLVWTRIVPYALLPPALCVYSMRHYPGLVLPAIAPAVQPLAFALLGLAAVALETGIVALMAGQLRLLAAGGEAFQETVSARQALVFASVVPVPLWLSSLALLWPSRAILASTIAVAWAASAWLVRSGVPELYGCVGPEQTRRLTRAVLARGLFAWLMVVGALVGPLYALASLS